MDFVVEKMTDSNWPEVKVIYEEGIATGDATFETEVPDWQLWDKNHLPECRLVARVENKVIGWAALGPVSSRCAYQGVAEVNLYVKASARGQAVGKALLEAVIKESEHNGIWTLQSCTFPENLASIALQKSLGFREVGYRERIGRMNGIWRDVILMERRSKVVGS